MEDVLAEVTRAEEAHAKRAKAERSLRRSNHFSAIDQYGKALDVISNTSSGILCPLWGSLRLLLHVCNLAPNRAPSLDELTLCLSRPPRVSMNTLFRS